MEGRERRAHLAMASCVLYCTPSTKGTGASRRGIMELGVTGIKRHCHLEGGGMQRGRGGWQPWKVAEGQRSQAGH